MIKNEKISLIALGLILLFGFLVRIYNLSSVPGGFFADEASIGYNAYSILHTGKDEYGEFLPLYFRAFGEYKNPVQIYSTIPFVLLFGLNEFSVRLVSVVYGILSIFAIYLLAQQFARDKTKKSVGLFAAFFLAVVPWHIHLSRISFEAFMPFIFFCSLGTYYFMKRGKYSLIFSGLLFTAAIYSYFPSRLFVPSFVIFLSILNTKNLIKSWQKTVIALLLALLILMPFIRHSLSPSGMERWRMVSIFENPTKDVHPLVHVARNYISHYSLEFLFTKGDIDMPGQFITRHSVRGFGELYLLQLPFIILGIVYLLKKKSYKNLGVLMGWIVLYPIGSMFTIDQSAQATRSIIGVIPFQILTALGIVGLASKFKQSLAKNLYFITVIVLTLLFAITYLYSFYTKYPSYSSDFWGWQYGARDIVHIFSSKENQYDQLIMAPEFNAPHIFLAFYSPMSCKKCRIGLPDDSLDQHLRQLFAVTPYYLSQHSEYLISQQQKIYYPNGEVAFVLGEITRR